jgi:SAM-dependent methyltransferase
MADYREQAYTRYAEPVALDYARYADAYRRRIGNRLALSARSRCLDLACGYGNFLAYLRSVGVEDYGGVDSARGAVDVARREFGDARAVCADVFAYLREVKTSLDLISALDLLEHVAKPELFELLALIRAALAPSGRFLLRTPNANGLFGMAARYNDITHEICFSTGAIADVLARAGFRTLVVWEDTGRPETLLQAAHWVAWQAVRLGIRCVNAAETGNWGDGVLTRNMWVLAGRQ